VQGDIKEAKNEGRGHSVFLITYGHYVIVAAWQAQRNVCKSIHILSAIPKCVMMTIIWMMTLMMMRGGTPHLPPALICIYVGCTLSAQPTQSV